jgi:hypothetical protein
MAHGPAPLYLVYDGSALDGLLYRIVRRCPPTVEDFRSYEALGIPYDRRDFFRGTGVSMHVSRKRSEAVARRFRREEARLRRSICAARRLRGRGREVVVTSPSGRCPTSFSERWFNVTSMSSGRFIVLDQASMNQLGEFDTLAEAKETLARFLAHAPEAAGDLEIWDDDEDLRIEIDPATLRPAPAA